MTPPRSWFSALLLAVLALGAGAVPVRAAEPVAVELRTLLRAAGGDDELRIACERIHASELLLRFYRERQYAPLWVTAAGPRPLFAATVAQLGRADRHGLKPEDYHLPCLQAAVERFRDAAPAPSARDLAEQEVVLTDAFLTFGSHLVAGRVDPEQLYPQWLSARRRGDLLRILGELERHGDVRQAVAQLAPARGEYNRSVAAAATLSGASWAPFAGRRDLQRGMVDPRLPALRRRLVASGDLADDRPRSGTLFDAGLAAAVARFQARHGLPADGIVGPATRRELNVPAAERRRQLLLNLERWRWLPRSWGRRYLLVNAADYALEAYDRGQRRLRMRVIVGEEYRRTPVFSDRMTYLELNPYWNVPASIAGEELLPKLRRNPAYLGRHGYQLLSGWEADARQLDPRAVDWQQVEPEHLPGRIRQLPGPRNPLGRIKFMFPNRFNVYLHDTPDRHLFRRDRRALSHGCIRVARPLDLAAFVLAETPGWDRERVAAEIGSGERQVVELAEPVPVHLLYLTAWVDAAGVRQFRSDIYQRDPVLWRALQGEPEEGARVSRRPEPPAEAGAAAD